eukprot:19349-Pyramimonas_sp.AAC.1
MVISLMHMVNSLMHMVNSLMHMVNLLMHMVNLPVSVANSACVHVCVHRSPGGLGRRDQLATDTTDIKPLLSHSTAGEFNSPPKHSPTLK